MIEAIASFFKAFAEYVGWARDRSKLKNTTAMQTADTNRKLQGVKDDASEAVSEGDIERIRKEFLAE